MRLFTTLGKSRYTARFQYHLSLYGRKMAQVIKKQRWKNTWLGLKVYIFFIVIRLYKHCNHNYGISLLKKHKLCKIWQYYNNIAMLLYDIKLVCYHNNVHYLFSLFFFWSYSSESWLLKCWVIIFHFQYIFLFRESKRLFYTLILAMNKN